MMKRLFILLLTLCSLSGYGQTVTQYLGTKTNTVLTQGGHKVDSALYLPTGTKYAPTWAGALRYNAADSSVYVWSGYNWIKPGTGITSLNGAATQSQTFAFSTTSGAMGWFTDNVAGVHTLRIPYATASDGGLINTTTQTFAGRKTFNAGIVLPTINQTADTLDWKPLVRHSTGVLAQGWWYGSGGGGTSLSTLTYGATTTWDYSTQGTEAKVTLTGNTTLSITNLPAGEVVYLTLEVVQDATGSRTLTLPAGTKVIGGGAGAITLTTTGGATDLLTFRWNGTTLFANLGTNYN